MQIFRFKTLALAGALTLQLAMTNEAHAEEAEVEGVVEVVIEELGIASFDDLYNKVKEIDTLVTGAAQDIANARAEMKTALGAAEGVTLEAAIADFKAKAPGMIKVDIADGKPQIGFTPDAPDDIKNTIGALNGAMGNLVMAKDKLAEVPTQMTDLGAQAKELADMKKLKAEAKASGIKGKEVPGLLKKTQGNNKALKFVPGNAEAVVNEANKTIELVKSIGG